jgi:Cu/Ag efflux protein CusF
MKRRFVTSVLAALPLLHLLPVQAAAPVPSSTETAALTAGEITKVDRQRGELVIRHGDLASLGMPAMTMAFAVSDKRLLDQFKPGDKVLFDAEIANGKPAVRHIQAQRP